MNTPIQRKIMRKLNNDIPIDSKMIEELIEDHSTDAAHTLSLWNRYIGKVPILHRELPDYAQENEKIANDFTGVIVNSKVGYFVGIPINYSIDKTKYEIESSEINANLYKSHTSYLSDFTLRNNMHDLDTEMVKTLAACGKGARKFYSDKEGNIRVVNVKPYDVILLINEHKEVEYALRYYKEYNEDDVIVTHVEFYDSESIHYYVEKDSEKRKAEDAKYVINPIYKINPELHVFDYCPFIFFQNNEECMSDTEKVLTLIESYDSVLSNNNNELNTFMLAYMYFTGEAPTKEVMEQATESGAFRVPEGSTVGFITKNLDATFGDSFLDRAGDNIFQFSQSVNFNEERFNQTSGIALKYKLQALNDKCIALESKYKRSLSEQMKILASAWNKLNIHVNYLDSYFQFIRNLPIDYDYEATYALKLKNLVSERTVLGLLSFVDDVEYELDELAKEREANNIQLTDPDKPIEKLFNMSNVPQGDVDESETVK